MMSRPWLIPSIALALAGMACAGEHKPADKFFATLAALCGKAFEGRLTTEDPRDSDLAGKVLIMHVRDCSTDVIRVPFHVGEDRSRTWVITRTAEGLRLKHDHRHEDGLEDAVTQYGGDTVSVGTATRQSFPADAFSREMFIRNGLGVSVTNIWSIEMPQDQFIYELRREDRHFAVSFDLTRPVDPPPAPWGTE